MDQTASDRIMDAYRSGYSIPPVSDEHRSFDEAAAYAIAAEIHTRRLAQGERPLGRKIGFTNRTIWDLYNVDTPIWGWMYDTTVHEGVTDLDVGSLLEPRIEPEIQLHFATTPPDTDNEEAILASIDWIAHGFEIVQCPFPGWRFTRPDTIAACGLHGALVIGRPVLVRDIDDPIAKLRSFTVSIARDGEVQGQGGGANVLDSPLLAFAHLMRVLRDGVHPVQAGEIVTTGTLTDAYPVAAGETWTTSIDGIDLPGATITFV